jgi:hypothetical protein
MVMSHAIADPASGEKLPALFQTRRNTSCRISSLPCSVPIYAADDREEFRTDTVIQSTESDAVARGDCDQQRCEVI